jgi:hypothetical protein
VGRSRSPRQISSVVRPLSSQKIVPRGHASRRFKTTSKPSRARKQAAYRMSWTMISSKAALASTGELSQFFLWQPRRVKRAPKGCTRHGAETGSSGPGRGADQGAVRAAYHTRRDCRSSTRRLVRPT